MLDLYSMVMAWRCMVGASMCPLAKRVAVCQHLAARAPRSLVQQHVFVLKPSATNKDGPLSGRWGFVHAVLPSPDGGNPQHVVAFKDVDVDGNKQATLLDLSNTEFLFDGMRSPLFSRRTVRALSHAEYISVVRPSPPN